MSKGGGGETQQVVQKNEPWSGVQPYLKDLYKSASGIYGKPQQFFPHQTYALQSPLSNVGQQAALGYANNYLPSLVNAGTAGVGSMLNAADVGNNPYVNQMLGQQVSGMTNAFSQNADTITRNLTREWLPQIRSGAGLAGIGLSRATWLSRLSGGRAGHCRLVLFRLCIVAQLGDA